MFRTLTQFLLDDDDGAGSGAPPPAAAPWQAELESTFADPAQRAAVDGFLRQTVQPYVTQIEQRSADLKDAQRLYEDLSGDQAGEAYLAITEELFGDEMAQSVLKALQEGRLPAAESTPPPAAAEAEAPAAGLDPETQQDLAWIRDQRRRDAYDAALADVKAKHTDVVESVFHPFVQAAGGDMDVAYSGYKQFLEQVRANPELIGLAPGSQPTEAEAAAAAAAAAEAAPPPVLGSDTASAAASTTPTEPQYSSIGDAIDDFFDSQKSAPPTLGSV